MNDENEDLWERTAASSSLGPLQKECDELLAIFTTISKKCKNAQYKDDV